MLLTSSSVTTRPLRSWDERESAVRLYRDTFELGANEPAVSPKLLAALQDNGGSAVGAFDTDGELIGFAYGFLGVDEGDLYHYSQAAAVAEAARGRGIGRLLKFAQAEVALPYGITRMRWAYDPMLARNAYFNLDVLRARGRWFRRDYYDLGDGPDRSDRVVVEWDLLAALRRSAGAPEAADAPQPGDPVDPRDTEGLGWGQSRRIGPTDGGENVLIVPAEWSEVVRRDPERAGVVRDLVAGELTQALRVGRVLVSCTRIDDARAAYRLSAARDAVRELPPDRPGESAGANDANDASGAHD